MIRVPSTDGRSQFVKAVGVCRAEGALMKVTLEAGQKIEINPTHIAIIY